MNYFKDGLNQEELDKQYRTLAKKYHPDVSSDPNAEEIMKAINEEYDKYFVSMRNTINGYNADEIFSWYKRAKERREIILVFMRRDKQHGKGFFTFNIDGKVSSDESDSWKDFRGGFAVCQLKKTTEPGFLRETVLDQTVTRLNHEVKFPNYADMYFGLYYGFESESTSLVNADIANAEHAFMDTYNTYTHIYSETYGDIWLSSECFSIGSWYFGNLRTIRRRYAYMKVDNYIMRCGFDLKREYYEERETIKGKDFGYLAFQDCTKEEFERTHDVDYYPDLASALECKRLVRFQDMYWIDDPLVAHFARTGVVKFYQSERKFKMRYGTFDSYALEKNLSKMTIDDAERIQDYLDILNGEFETASKNLVKKGKIKINI